VSDHPLEAAVMQALAENPLVHADEIAVQVIGGDVVLRGTVGTRVQQAEAVRTARNVPGAWTVDDQLRVRPLGIDGRADADTEAAVLAARIADDDLHADDVAERVTDAIGVDAIVGADQITVNVRDNDVTLTGTVTSREHRAIAVAAAAGAPGVADVHDELSVRSQAR